MRLRERKFQKLKAESSSKIKMYEIKVSPQKQKPSGQTWDEAKWD